MKPPIVDLGKNAPLQDFYNDGSGNLYSVARLVDLAKDLPVFDVPLAAIQVSGRPWDGEDMLCLASHVKLCMDADLDYPILLDWRGRIADGRHRVIKALALGETTIKARRLTWQPGPDKTEAES